MYNKEGVARCHADRQTTERDYEREGARRQTSTVNFICLFQREPPVPRLSRERLSRLLPIAKERGIGAVFARSRNPYAN